MTGKQRGTFLGVTIAASIVSPAATEQSPSAPEFNQKGVNPLSHLPIEYPILGQNGRIPELPRVI